MDYPDKSNGYEEIAAAFATARDLSSVGASVVAEWSRALPAGGTVLDVGCGTGVPVTQVLVDRGFLVYGVDASPTLVAAFRVRFPNAPVECAAAEDSAFFKRQFDAVIAWGLLFLLDEEAQRKLIHKIASVLQPGGRFLFTAPSQTCSWRDNMTGQLSISLGHDAYQTALQAAGLPLTGTRPDEGENHYYFAQKNSVGNATRTTGVQ
jgi:2-polyprenyl-3-methyl-5-hydroxy-6-metoxy-1,4-benzoquinol methylase